VKKSRQVQKIIERFPNEGEIIALLLDIQRRQGYLSKEALSQVAVERKIPLSLLYGIATFYSQFSLHPRGKHVIHVCQGTACHVQGASEIALTIKQELGINEGETTRDKQFTLEYVNCLGCCSLAPVLVVNNSGVQAHMTSAKVKKLLKRLKGGKR
jgi:NADH-quinone oxidoreductase subunit E